VKILVVGGAGYLGSHVTRALLDQGHEAVVFDNLSTGHRDAVPTRVVLRGDLSNRVLLDTVLSTRAFDCVLHFASSGRASESAVDPSKYYWNNLANTLNLLDAMAKRQLTRLVYCSSAAVYGEARYLPVEEAHPRNPASPYGRSKWMVEQALADYGRAHGLRYVALRCFNAGGADPSGTLGARHHPETHLIPLALKAAAGRAPAVPVYGTDYDTADGTCFRDYVHVVDVCQAHLLAIHHLLEGGKSRAYNVGSGRGYSVREVIDCAARVTGAPIPIAETGRREGDLEQSVADVTAARRELGWRPQHSDLDTIIAHAWQWERAGRGAKRRVA
jgi:UDP-glucose 4-epimerase